MDGNGDGVKNRVDPLLAPVGKSNITGRSGGLY